MKKQYSLFFILGLLLSSLLVGGCIRSAPATGPSGPLLPVNLRWVGNLGTIQAQEPSGIVYHAAHDTFYVVSDEGEVVEMTLEGEIIQLTDILQDLEGITLDPIHNTLYIAVEGKEKIILLDAETLEQIGSYKLNRTFEGAILLAEGGGGIEAITFVPNLDNRQQARLYLSDQIPNNTDSTKGSIIFWVDIDPTAKPDIQTPLEISGYFEIAIPDISGLEYIDSNQHLLLLSDSKNLLMEITQANEIIAEIEIQGRDQEGVTLIDYAYVLIAQDSGEIQYYEFDEE